MPAASPSPQEGLPREVRAYLSGCVDICIQTVRTEDLTLAELTERLRPPDAIVSHLKYFLGYQAADSRSGFLTAVRAAPTLMQCDPLVAVTRGTPEDPAQIVVIYPESILFNGTFGVEVIGPPANQTAVERAKDIARHDCQIAAAAEPVIGMKSQLVPSSEPTARNGLVLRGIPIPAGSQLADAVAPAGGRSHWLRDLLIGGGVLTILAGAGYAVFGGKKERDSSPPVPERGSATGSLDPILPPVPEWHAIGGWNPGPVKAPLPVNKANPLLPVSERAKLVLKTPTDKVDPQLTSELAKSKDDVFFDDHYKAWVVLMAHDQAARDLRALLDFTPLDDDLHDRVIKIESNREKLNLEIRSTLEKYKSFDGVSFALAAEVGVFQSGKHFQVTFTDHSKQDIIYRGMTWGPSSSIGKGRITYNDPPVRTERDRPSDLAAHFIVIEAPRDQREFISIPKVVEILPK